MMRASFTRISIKPARAFALFAAAFLCSWVSVAVATARPATKLVRYRGYTIAVPPTWPVYDLSSNPTVCVRFDRHAVYLGDPSPAQRCPAHAVGRTEAILISPLIAQAARAGGSGTGPSLPPVSVPGAQVGLGSVARVPVEARGIIVTATWGPDPGLIARALHVRPGGLVRAAAFGRPNRRASAARGAALGSRAAGSAGSVFTGLGFDACSAPSQSQMVAWGASHYRGVGVYIGGTNMACSQPNLTPSWVSAESAAGWHLIPTYVGLQAPSSACGCATIVPKQAASEGTAAATDAVTQAQAAGIGPGSPIYFDMEAYTPGGKSTSSVLTFLAAWTTQLHADGYVSGVYSSGASGITDLAAAYGTGYLEPDDLWIADWNGQQATTDPYVPAADWAQHQRLHQYDGAHNETHGGVTLNIDGDYLDGQTAGGSWIAPPDGTLVALAGAAPIYRLAGGAPLYVNDWNAVGGPQAYTALTASQWASLKPVPADGTFLMTSTGGAYRVAGGAPLWVSDWSVFGGVQPYVQIDQWDIDNITNPLAHLNAVPANGTWLITPAGQFYRVAGGTPFPVASRAPYGRVHSAVTIDPWNIQNISSPQSHLLATPLDGTVVKGIPSRTYWLFKGGKRAAVGVTPGAVAVDDASLTAFAILPPPVRCVVPKLKHRTLRQAKRALRRSHCRLGKVNIPHGRNPHRLHVISQAPRPQVTRRMGYAVRLTLG
jgi:hypothetical protein